MRYIDSRGKLKEGEILVIYNAQQVVYGAIRTTIDLRSQSRFALKKCSHSFRSISVRIRAFTFRSLLT